MSSPDRGPLARLLALAWDYRAVCLRVLAGQLASLALGLGALSGSGLAVDVVRRALDPSAPPVRWPFGIMPPAAWSPASSSNRSGGTIRCRKPFFRQIEQLQRTIGASAAVTRKRTRPQWQPPS